MTFTKSGHSRLGTGEPGGEELFQHTTRDHFEFAAYAIRHKGSRGFRMTRTIVDTKKVGNLE